MVLFTDSETRQRHKDSERVLQEVQSILTEPAITKRLGSTARLLLHLSKDLYIPNYRNGRIEKPRSAKRPHAVALLALKHGESFVTDPAVTAPLPGQEAYLEHWLSEISAPGRTFTATDYYKDFGVETGGAKMDLPTSASGFVASPTRTTSFTHTKYGKPLERIVRSRPVVAFDQGVTQDISSGPVMIHELLHLAQVYEFSTHTVVKPSAARELTLRDELEAYHIEGLVESILYRESTDPRKKGNDDILSDIAFEIDEARQQVNAGGKDPFKPDGKIPKLLDEVGLDVFAS